MSKHPAGWPEAKKLCRLNQDDIVMAKRLGLRPDTLVRARPNPGQKWKLPVKGWIHELHFTRLGYTLGEKPLSTPPPMTPEEKEDGARLYGEQVYWEEYCERNQDNCAGKQQARRSTKLTTTAIRTGDKLPLTEKIVDDEDRDVPF
jgi:hypothetical protein